MIDIISDSLKEKLNDLLMPLFKRDGNEWNALFRSSPKRDAWSLSYLPKSMQKSCVTYEIVKLFKKEYDK